MEMKKTKRSTTAAIIATLSLVVSICVSRTGRIVSADSEKGSTRQNAANSAKRYPLLSRYATDLTRLARQGKLETISGHRAEIRQLLDALSAGTNRNPVLINDGINLDTSEIISGLAQRIVAGKAPENLRDKRIFSLSLDRLSAGARDSEEFVARFSATLNEAAAAKGQIILFVEQLHQYVGSYANQVASAAIQSALSQGQFRVIGAATSDEYAAHISTDESLAALFQTIRIDDASAITSESSNSENDNANASAFVGEKVSTDLRELAQSVNSENDSVGVILQADDVRNPELTKLLKRNGALITYRMAQVGAMKIQVPVKAIAELAANHLTNYISPDVKLETLGHVTATTGTDLVRTQTAGTVSTTFDGTGIGIAILDSGIDGAHRAFKQGVRFSKDFTARTRPTLILLAMELTSLQLLLEPARRAAIFIKGLRPPPVSSACGSWTRKASAAAPLC